MTFVQGSDVDKLHALGGAYAAMSMACAGCQLAGTIAEKFTASSAQESVRKAIVAVEAAMKALEECGDLAARGINSQLRGKA